MSEVVRLVKDKYFAFRPYLDGNEMDAGVPALGIVHIDALVLEGMAEHRETLKKLQATTGVVKLGVLGLVLNDWALWYDQAASAHADARALIDRLENEDQDWIELTQKQYDSVSDSLEEMRTTCDIVLMESKGIIYSADDHYVALVYVSALLEWGQLFGEEPQGGTSDQVCEG
jgi:hypothetical protein